MVDGRQNDWGKLFKASICDPRISQQMQAEGIDSFPLTPDSSLAVRLCDNVLGAVLFKFGITGDEVNSYGIYIEGLQDIANRYRMEAT